MFFTNKTFAQYNWTLQKNKNDIKVFSSEMQNSQFKAIKVECTLAGNYSKLISILSDVSQFSKWIYNTKSARMLHQNTPVDFLYYTEFQLPWPMSNRDAIIHLKIRTDSLPRLLTITGKSEPTFISEVKDKVRVINYKSNWRVTMPTNKTIQIVYMLEFNPAGSIPPWISNSFSEKGPFETFSKLADKLKH
jgi:hypothetical protein